MMNESHQDPNQDSHNGDLLQRCLVCDSVLQLTKDGRCLMCGVVVNLEDQQAVEYQDRSEDSVEGSIKSAATVFVEEEEREPAPIVESTLQEQQSPITIFLAIGVFVVVCILGFLVLQNPAPTTLFLFPTRTSLPPTPTQTVTWTPLATETTFPTDTPTITLTSLPTATPQPPRSHSVALGETLFGLSLRYGVTMDSIAEASGLPANSGIQVSQQLVIPWPTATPPLEPVEVAVGGETVVADPTDCRMYEIKGGDTFFGISAREKIDLQAMMVVNRLTEQSVLQPGDLICIPKILRGGAIPPTAGPSPTASATAPPPGPYLLYPANGTRIEQDVDPLFLQWAAVKDLEETEWYMVEVTNLTDVDSHPQRGFTRQNSFLVPISWRPEFEEVHDFRWRIRIVQVSGQREDGSFIYTFGGTNSEDAFFSWFGSIPMATPTAAATPVAPSNS